MNMNTTEVRPLDDRRAIWIYTRPVAEAVG